MGRLRRLAAAAGVLSGIVLAVGAPAPPASSAAAAPATTGTDFVSGADLATLAAAAERTAPGARVDQIEIDPADATYAVHLTGPTGSRSTVRFSALLRPISRSAPRPRPWRPAAPPR